MGIKVENLDNWLSYINQDVIDSFLRSFSINKQEAELIFSDMLRFLWLASSSEKERFNSLLNQIDTPILIIDEMWHTFILFTKDYREFCMNYIGTFYDHCPTTTAGIKSHFDSLSSESGKKIFAENKRERYSRIYDIFGEETFQRWFLIYPEVYSRENILKLRFK